ncbi:MAG: ATP-grasp domain-containing protein [Desulfitobacteriaceae bacterium]|nr:ATP-grasp domain-containing protein [Desulfitobacteriaceae bacterium]
MKGFNILFTSSGRRVSLIRHFKEAMKELKIEGVVVSADMLKTAPASFVADFQEVIPPAGHPSYLKILKEICIRYKIKLLIPLIDTELGALSRVKEEFRRIGVTILVSSPETTEICFDKRNTDAFLRSLGVSTPEMISFNDNLENTHLRYPLLIKPASGSGSNGVTKIRNARELEFFLSYVNDPIVQEFVFGDEYTLDVLVDLQGKVRCVVPRLRIETRAGEVSKGITVKNYEIMFIGQKVAENLPGALGCITVQLFLTYEGQIKVTEINPRFGGGFPLSIQAGADYPSWILQMMLGENPVIVFDGWKDGVVMLRYDDAIFLTRDMIL